MYLWCKDKVFWFNLQTFWEFFIRIQLKRVSVLNKKGSRLQDAKSILKNGSQAGFIGKKLYLKKDSEKSLFPIRIIQTKLTTRT